MKLIPAIDVLDGKVVRLRQGRYEAVTTYGEDPLAVATRFEGAGASHLHVVDLDGAREGRPMQAACVQRIVRGCGLAVQVGGGIRTWEAARYWADAGVWRIVLGTAAVKEPELLPRLVGELDVGVVAAVDARAGRVAVEGWLEQVDLTHEELARRADGWGVDAILYTSIERDGTGDGPDVQGTAALQRVVRAPVIASGGIGGLEHVRALARAGVRAAVCGKALISGAFDLRDAVAVAEEGA